MPTYGVYQTPSPHLMTQTLHVNERRKENNIPQHPSQTSLTSPPSSSPLPYLHLSLYLHLRIYYHSHPHPSYSLYPLHHFPPIYFSSSPPYPFSHPYQPPIPPVFPPFPF